MDASNRIFSSSLTSRSDDSVNSDITHDEYTYSIASEAFVEIFGEQICSSQLQSSVSSTAFTGRTLPQGFTREQVIRLLQNVHNHKPEQAFYLTVWPKAPFFR